MKKYLVALTLLLLIIAITIATILFRDKFVPSSESVSKEQAVQKIEALPEVHAYEARLSSKGETAIVEVVNDAPIFDTSIGERYWPVQVHAHIAGKDTTFAWYLVYVDSGSVVKNPT